MLQITTRAHCGSRNNVPSMANHTGRAGRARCLTDGLDRTYSTGRAQSGFVTPPGVNFRIKFSAAMPVNGTTGTRMALWAKNSQQYCDAAPQQRRNLAEYDVLE